MVRSLLLGKPGHKDDVRLRTKKPRALIPAFDLQFAFMSLSLKRCRGRMKSWLGQRDGEGRRLWACSLTSLRLVPTTFLSLGFSASWGGKAPFVSPPSPLFTNSLELFLPAVLCEAKAENSCTPEKQNRRLTMGRRQVRDALFLHQTGKHCSLEKKICEIQNASPLD